MLDEPGRPLTYEVVTDELIAASRAIAQVTASAKAGLVEALPTLAATRGHDRLEVTLQDFCARWDTGLSHLVGDGEAMSQRLTGCANRYLENEDQASDGYQQLISCAPAPVTLHAFTGPPGLLTPTAASPAPWHS